MDGLFRTSLKSERVPQKVHHGLHHPSILVCNFYRQTTCHQTADEWSARSGVGQDLPAGVESVRRRAAVSLPVPRVRHSLGNHRVVRPRHGIDGRIDRSRRPGHLNVLPHSNHPRRKAHSSQLACGRLCADELGGTERERALAARRGYHEHEEWDLGRGTYRGCFAWSAGCMLVASSEGGKKGRLTNFTNEYCVDETQKSVFPECIDSTMDVTDERRT